MAEVGTWDETVAEEFCDYVRKILHAAGRDGYSDQLHEMAKVVKEYSLPCTARALVTDTRDKAWNCQIPISSANMRAFAQWFLKRYKAELDSGVVSQPTGCKNDNSKQLGSLVNKLKYLLTKGAKSTLRTQIVTDNGVSIRIFPDHSDLTDAIIDMAESKVQESKSMVSPRFSFKRFNADHDVLNIATTFAEFGVCGKKFLEGRCTLSNSNFQ